ncbi:MAG: hypothetical protein SFZ23_12625 [Planctomycetota bacterium]|nr:hypothetical protein [Planctomycetota bacterium]
MDMDTIRPVASILGGIVIFIVLITVGLRTLARLITKQTPSWGRACGTAIIISLVAFVVQFIIQSAVDPSQPLVHVLLALPILLVAQSGITAVSFKTTFLRGFLITLAIWGIAFCLFCLVNALVLHLIKSDLQMYAPPGQGP